MSWFATAALQRYYNEKSMKLLLRRNQTTSDPPCEVAVDSYSDRKMFTYRSGIQQITTDIAAGNPISGALCRASGIIYCMLICDKKKMMIAINMNDDFGVILGNTYHTPISIMINCGVVAILPRVDLSFVLLLPNRNTDAKFGDNYYYYCVTDDWKERSIDTINNDKIVYILPKIDDVTYS
jgi:hypothetical protein